MGINHKRAAVKPPTTVPRRDPSGVINWLKLVRSNSGNYDMDRFLSGGG